MSFDPVSPAIQPEPTEICRRAEPAGRPLPADPDALLYPAEAAHLLGLSVRTLEAYRLKGGGPVYVALGRRCVRYRRSDLVAWTEPRRRRHTSDADAQVNTEMRR